MKISEILIPRRDVLDRSFQGFVQLCDVGKEGKLEGDARRFLTVTQPTEALGMIIAQTEAALKQGGRGNFFLTGTYGTGKTHSLIALFHIFNNPEMGNLWLKDNGFSLRIPKNVKTAWVSGTDDQPDYLWEVLLRRLGREDLIVEAADGTAKPPDKYAIRELAKDPLVFFVDEIEDWYGDLAEERRGRNRNFLQVISEVASDPDYNLFVFTTFLDKDFELKRFLEGRVPTVSIDMIASVSWNDVIKHRLFENKPDEKAKAIAKEYAMISDELKAESIFSSYPFHPEIIRVLRGIYGPEGYLEGVRNPLRVLADAVADNYEKRDLILVCDFNYDRNDPHSLLVKLNRPLAAVWYEDVKRCKEIKKSEDLMEVIYAYSLLPIPGTTKDQILQGVFRPGDSSDDLLMSLEEILKGDKAYHIKSQNGRILVTLEPSLLKMISDHANRIRDPDVPKEKLCEVLKDQVFKNVLLTTQKLEEVLNTQNFKVFVSPIEMSDEEISNFYSRFKYQNMLTVVLPRPGDSAFDDELIEKSKRLVAAEGLVDESGIDLQELGVEKGRILNEIRSSLKERYGRATYYTREGSLKREPVGVSVEEIKDKLSAGMPSIGFAIREKAKEGLTAVKMLEDFRILRNAPMVLKDGLFYEALKREYESEKIGLDGNKQYHIKIERFPDFQTAMYAIVRPASEIAMRAQFHLESFSVPSGINEGESILTKAIVKNVGNMRGSGSAHFFVDGEEIGSADFELESGDVQKVEFEYLPKISGEYNLTISLDNQSESKTVVVRSERKEPVFSVSSFQVPEEVHIGDEIPISATINNIGDAPGSLEVCLKKNDFEIVKAEISLEVDGEDSLSQVLSFDEQGTYSISLVLDGVTKRRKIVAVLPRVYGVETTSQGRVPLEFQELQESDEITELQIKLLREERISKQELKDFISSLPSGLPIKVDMKVLRKDE